MPENGVGGADSGLGTLEEEPPENGLGHDEPGNTMNGIGDDGLEPDPAPNAERPETTKKRPESGAGKRPVTGANRSGSEGMETMAEERLDDDTNIDMAGQVDTTGNDGSNDGNFEIGDSGAGNDDTRASGIL